MNKYNIPERLPHSLAGLNDLIQYIQEREDAKQLDLLEIGSWTGLSAVLFARAFKSITCIDPWSPTGGINLNYDMDNVYKLFCERTKIYDNVTAVKSKFEDYEIDKNYDIIYIDGLHTYDQVKKDIKKALGIKSLKYIAGHDYYNKFPGVKRAVNELLGTPDQLFTDSSWIKKI